MKRLKKSLTKNKSIDGSKNRTPTKSDLEQENALYRFYLKGFTPEKPFLDKTTSTIAFGSCFAIEITKRLKACGLNVFERKHRVPIVEAFSNFNTTFTVRQQFEWVFKGWKPDDNLWWDIETRNVLEPRVQARIETKKAVIAADVFFITLGLSEAWYNSETGGYFWYAPRDIDLDLNIHKFKISTVSENKDNLEEIWSIIKDNNPSAKVIFSLSPIPLKNTYRQTASVPANTVSKSILRVAIDEFIRNHLEDLNIDLFYWPAYEIAKEYFIDPYLEDNRHLKQEVIDTIVNEFIRYFVIDGY